MSSQAKKKFCDLVTLVDLLAKLSAAAAAAASSQFLLTFLI